MRAEEFLGNDALSEGAIEAEQEFSRTLSCNPCVERARCFDLDPPGSPGLRGKRELICRFPQQQFLRFFPLLGNPFPSRFRAHIGTDANSLGFNQL